jgi:O-antigen/teichoic acid export membrane protein
LLHVKKLLLCWSVTIWFGTLSAKAEITIFSPDQVLVKNYLIDSDYVVKNRPESADVWLLAASDWSQVERRAEVWLEGDQKRVLLLFIDQPSFSFQFAGLQIEAISTRHSVTIVPGAGLPSIDKWPDSINWKSAPAVNKVFLPEIGGDSESVCLVETRENRACILNRIQLSSSCTLLLFSFPLSEENREITGWPFFRYFLDSTVRNALGHEVETFTDWDFNPLPHRNFQRISFAVLLGLLVLTLAMFRKARRVEVVPRDGQEKKVAGDSERLWSLVRFERPLAGFLFLISLTILLLIPTFYYTNVFFPNRIVPSPQALGMDRWVLWFFTFFWLFFDLGTGDAMVKYFSQHISTRPAKAYRYVNFFVWWQVFTGLLQLSIVVFAAYLLLKQTAYAYLSFLFIFHSLRQYPGLFFVRDDQQPLAAQSFFTLFFRAAQRFDLEQTLRVISIFVMVVCQIIGILTVRQWGQTHPQYGEILSMAIGISLSSFVAYAISFLLGALLCVRHGFSLTQLFAARFDIETAKQSLSFGGRVIAGNLAFQFAELVQTLLIAGLLFRYTELLGIWFFMMNFGALYHAIRPFTDSLIPVVSEAVNTGRRRFFEYSITSGIRYGSLYGLCIAALLASASAPFIRTFTDPQWHMAAHFLPIFALWGYLIHPTHIAGSVLLGAGRPGLYSATIGLEQFFRLGLMVFLIPEYQFWGIILAYLFPIVLKNILAWWLIWWKVIRFRFYWWPALISPSLASILVGLLTWMCGIGYWKLPNPWVEICFSINVLLAFPLTFFFNGLFGGWDDAGLEELRNAGRMAGIMQYPASLLIRFASAGKALTPLRQLGRIPTRFEADQEADPL